MSYKLLVETPAPKEDFEYILQEDKENDKKTLFIKGPYMMANDVNRNKRFYPLDELRREVTRYTRDMVRENRSMGELNHPTTAEVDLERACHMVTDIWEEGNMFFGKSKVLSGKGSLWNILSIKWYSSSQSRHLTIACIELGVSGLFKINSLSLSEYSGHFLYETEKGIEISPG